MHIQSSYIRCVPQLQFQFGDRGSLLAEDVREGMDALTLTLRPELVRYGEEMLRSPYSLQQMPRIGKKPLNSFSVMLPERTPDLQCV